MLRELSFPVSSQQPQQIVKTSSQLPFLSLLTVTYLRTDENLCLQGKLGPNRKQCEKECVCPSHLSPEKSSGLVIAVPR